MNQAVLSLVATTFVGSLSLVAAAAPAVQEKPPVAKVTGGDELVKKKGYFRETWVSPDADITKYNKIHLWNAVFQFRDLGEKKTVKTTSSILQSPEGLFPVAPESREKFRQVVVGAFVKELEHSKRFEVVDTVGPGTLLLRGAIFDIVSNVPPQLNRGNVYLSSVGEGTFVIELIDAETGEILARVAERRRIQPPGGGGGKPANAATVWADVEQWAWGVASDFRRELDKAQEKANKKKQQQ